MKTTKKHPTCPQCQQFDDDTRALMGQLFSDDEKRILTLLIANTLQGISNFIGQLSTDDIRRVTSQRDSDVLGCTLGKFMISHGSEGKRAIRETLKKMGVTLNIEHETCPHQDAQGNPLSLVDMDPAHLSKEEA